MIDEREQRPIRRQRALEAERGSGAGFASTACPRDQDRALANTLVGRAIPALRLTAFTGAHRELRRDTDPAAVIYCYPGTVSSPDGGSDSGVGDAAQHQAFDRHRDELNLFALRAIGLSSESEHAQRATAFENRIGHELWSDPDMLLARALGLPTFAQAGVSGYRRLTVVVFAGKIAKAFFPVESPQRTAAQVISWLKATGH
ncbi:MAG TPA: hypothetical protein VMF09_10840 [Solirubrobacteraceae bacterium]|nr:hypothetical protein [Solirubrobacteraceae bacterium]